MTTTSIARLMVTAAILFPPVAASAESPAMASAQLAQNSVASAPVAATDSKGAPAAAADKKICKQLPSSYSRMTQRVCLTEKEWKQAEQDAQD